MNVQRWINRRRPDWQRLEAILQTEQGVLSGEDLQALGGLYRQVSADLAKAQMRRMGSDLTGYLQGLTLKAHNLIYQPPVFSWPTAARTFLKQLPSQIRTLWPYIATSTAIFLGGMVVGGILYLSDATFIQTMLSAEAIEGVEKKRQLWVTSTTAVAPLSSSSLMTNNISVAFTAFAGGMLFGLGTVYILFFNGVLLGAVSLFVAENGLSFPFWAFVSAHGVPELSAVFIAGAAGLMLAEALIRPWPYRRADRLTLQSRRAVPLLILVVALLVVAGIIEGFISPNDGIQPLVKYGIGLGEMALLGIFVRWGSRRTLDSPAPDVEYPVPGAENQASLR
ncbi:stage II sporulation protein M [Anthocerotibacter panamensis]|uniref:stage II sporulation protein M n=1 Tax=Anthocerotibacter panamensis TaxID=2857077 RepID=UPI001C401F1C|nr:stage II sporulation protein M [Anthocerotibacter panamensis]